ncbi:hypothetical protein Pan44_00840 [Caulifigura coniformis]|uniref:Uncharacterized protein n=1 Tax=Caulifigura coniformis TaxID=2527983 RepID=A0A517S7H6_9PLAN|nr:hypothetical protein [Caulifigura coniformis]QDT52076.1 hypothetical protein Pan44_00840 [Caulifigura coniformis]
MWKSHKRQRPIAVAFGGACLFSLGFAGCAREPGLELANQDVRSDSAITERANESILRSRKELASASGSSAPVPGIATTEPEIDERPSLASRWTAPFRSAGNLLKRKPEEVQDDPFLAESKKLKDSVARESVASTAKTGGAESKAADRPSGETVVAMADRIAKTEAGTAKVGPKAAQNSESQAALDDFLKSQEPIGVNDRALAAGTASPTLTRKPGTSPEPRPMVDDRASSSDVAASDEARASFEEFATSRRSVAKASAARPFPATDESELDNVAMPPARQSARNPLAAAPAGVRRNPLADAAEEVAEGAAVASKSQQANGREIAGLLKKAKSAGDKGEFEQALSYTSAASELAEQCSYEFAAREATPEKLVRWLEAKQASMERAAEAEAERRQIAATQRPNRDLAARPTGFSRPNAESVFADEVAESVAAAETASAGQLTNSPFNEWAAGVGREPSARAASPEWPVLSNRELAASDGLWQASRSEFEQSWTDLRSNKPSTRHQPSAETRLASAEEDAPSFVATAEAEGMRSIAHTVRPSDPIVQLGQPTDLAPGAEAAAARSGHRRGPRLATPPPLSIEHEREPRVVASKARGSKSSRMVWFAIIGGLSIGVLAAFRRWAYRTPQA